MAEVALDDAWLTGPEAARLASMRFPKRRLESRLGRWTAKSAIARALDRPFDADGLRSVAVRNASDGAPEAFVGDRPAPVVISMTDRADWAVCVVATGVDAVGCDLELVEPRSHRFVEDWFTPAEQEVVASSPEEHDLWANLIWSAKESALKVLRQGLRLDTRTVEVTFGDEEHDGWRSLLVTSTTGETFPGWWARHGDFVLTTAATSPVPPPTPLTTPTPLATAIPTHTWLSAAAGEQG
ncbi:MAG: 4'-phosphopantetheinyl transferase superfamily protein [Actinomycetota bacterium]|nr:4'-phosphopantetheinyl transferase superfamily protein [Actinomycetota bacterium]